MVEIRLWWDLARISVVMNEIEIHERSMQAFWERQMLSVLKTFA